MVRVTSQFARLAQMILPYKLFRCCFISSIRQHLGYLQIVLNLVSKHHLLVQYGHKQPTNIYTWENTLMVLSIALTICCCFTCGTPLILPTPSWCLPRSQFEGWHLPCTPEPCVRRVLEAEQSSRQPGALNPCPNRKGRRKAQICTNPSIPLILLLDFTFSALHLSMCYLSSLHELPGSFLLLRSKDFSWLLR